MFLAQLAASALVWAVTVFVLARRRKALLNRFVALPRGRRAAFAVSTLASSVALLALGMLALAAGGLTPAGLTWWGWPLITLVGVGFVVLQTLALVPLGLNAVTRDGARASDREDSHRP